MSRVEIIILWLIAGRQVTGMVGPNCQVQTSRQLTPTDEEVKMKNHYSLVRMATAVFREMRSLRALGYTEYEVGPGKNKSEFFCCKSPEMCLLTAPATDWSDVAVTQLSQLGETGVVHDAVLLRLDMKPPGTTSTTTTTTTTTTPIRTTTGSSTGLADSLTEPEPDPVIRRRKRSLPWRSQIQMVCVLGGVSGSNQRCENVLTKTVQRANLDKTMPTFSDLQTGVIHVLIETADQFRMEPLAGRGQKGPCPYITKKNAHYQAYEQLMSAGTSVLGRMLGQLKSLEFLYSDRLVIVQGCRSEILQLIACQYLELDCLNIPRGREQAVRKLCREVEKYEPEEQTARNLLWNILVYDYAESIEALISNTNLIALNQQALERSLKIVAKGVTRLQSRASQALQELRADLNNLGMKIFHLNGQSELKNFLLGISIGRENLGRELSSVQTALSNLAGQFSQEMQGLLGLLKGRQQCRFTRRNKIICTVSVGVVGEPVNNGLIVLSEGEVQQIEEYRRVECLPVGQLISRLHDGLWLLSGEHLVRGREKYLERCLYDRDSTGECADTMTPLTEAHRPGRLFSGQTIYYLYQEDGLQVNCEGNAETVQQIKDRARNTISITTEPTFIAWSQFPLTSGGVTARRRDVEEHAGGDGQELLMVLQRFQRNQYRLHLDGYDAENKNGSSLGEMILDFPNLIKTNKIVQTISGAGLALIIIVVVMIGVCCLCSERCREAARSCLCCCCRWREAVSVTRARLAREKASWDEYQMIRQQEKAHQAGAELPRWRKERARRGPPEDHIETAPMM